MAAKPMPNDRDVVAALFRQAGQWLLACSPYIDTNAMAREVYRQFLRDPSARGGVGSQLEVLTDRAGREAAAPEGAWTNLLRDYIDGDVKARAAEAIDTHVRRAALVKGSVLDKIHTFNPDPDYIAILAADVQRIQNEAAAKLEDFPVAARTEPDWVRCSQGDLCCANDVEKRAGYANHLEAEGLLLELKKKPGSGEVTHVVFADTTEGQTLKAKVVLLIAEKKGRKRRRG